MNCRFFSKKKKKTFHIKFSLFVFIVFNATLKQYFSYIVMVSFIGGGKRSARRKPLTHHKSLTNFIT